MRYRCEIEKIDDTYHASGQLDRTFRKFVDANAFEEEIYFNLRDLISINSGGIREWVMMMLKVKKSYIELHECPKVFIDQVNTVKDFVPLNAKIMSFYVPYYTEKSDSEKNVLFEPYKNYTEKMITPIKKVFDAKGMNSISISLSQNILSL